MENRHGPLSEDWTESYSDPPLIIEVSMILDSGLTQAERTKFKRLEGRISAIFRAVGVLIRQCQGVGEGDQRTIGFVPGLIGPPLISLPAAQFLADTEDQVLQDLEARIEKMAKRG